MRNTTLLGLAIVSGGLTAAILIGVHNSDVLGPPNGCTAKVNGNVVALSPTQGENAALIAAIGIQRSLPARAVSIALATAYQESKIQNLPGGDRDSLGLFQQRPSQGWGSAAEILNPVFAINSFYEALQKIPNYQNLEITVAAQKVQRSAYPNAYQRHAADARTLASALTGNSPAGFSCGAESSSDVSAADSVITTLKKGYGSMITPQPTARGDVTVSVTSNALGWSLAQYAVAMAADLHLRSVSFGQKVWHAGNASSKGWTTDRSTSNRIVTITLS